MIGGLTVILWDEPHNPLAVYALKEDPVVHLIRVRMTSRTHIWRHNEYLDDIHQPHSTYEQRTDSTYTRLTQQRHTRDLSQYRSMYEHQTGSIYTATTYTTRAWTLWHKEWSATRQWRDFLCGATTSGRRHCGDSASWTEGVSRW